MLIGKSRLVGECVYNLDPDLTASTVRPGSCDGVADAAVHQPARTALVKPLVPGGKQLAGSGQCGVEFLTVLHSFLVGEAVVVTGEEDLTWRKAFANVQRSSNTPYTTAAIGRYLSERLLTSLPDCLVAEPSGVTLVEAFLEGCLQLQGAGDDRPGALAGLLSLHKGVEVSLGYIPGEGVMRMMSGKGVVLKGTAPASWAGVAMVALFWMQAAFAFSKFRV
ncbi:hypothetical protein EYF80_009938 [Liparis tanakae]|uniref:Uncharacterized protein n=1 Tax=Liparis tanakae TaxID=230148 RepID=A0A4Z2IPZ3_9TELE|nr:hypothetical protein EYF80_009938 [Liparis tanakae]